MSRIKASFNDLSMNILLILDILILTFSVLMSCSDLLKLLKFSGAQCSCNKCMLSPTLILAKKDRKKVLYFMGDGYPFDFKALNYLGAA